MFHIQFIKFEIDKLWIVFVVMSVAFRGQVFSSVSAAPAVSTLTVKYIWETTEDES